MTLFELGLVHGLEKTAASRPFLRDYVRHSALNAGQAARDLRYLTNHPGADDVAEEGTARHRLESLKRRVPSLANNLLYTSLPPQWHHTPESMADLDKGTAREWFMSGYAPWKHKIKGDSYDGSRDKPKTASAGLVPPQAVRAAARRGLEERRQAPASRRGGLTAAEAGAQGIGSGVVRAQTLASGRALSPETVKRMHAFFSRHRKNKDTPKGRIAWLLWGGDAGAAWAKSQVSKTAA